MKTLTQAEASNTVPSEWKITGSGE